jgi:predicted nuclease of predicted toxin-antitoxin system
MSYASDLEIALYAIRNKLILVTFDLDFVHPRFGVTDLSAIMLRISNQTPTSVHDALQRFHITVDPGSIRPGMLFVIDDAKIRIRTAIF